MIPREAKARLHEPPNASSSAIGHALPRICGPEPQATGNRHADIPQNSGAPAHLAVFHVHFPIILKFGDAGEGTGWKKGSPVVGEAAESQKTVRILLAVD